MCQQFSNNSAFLEILVLNKEINVYEGKTQLIYFSQQDDSFKKS